MVSFFFTQKVVRNATGGMSARKNRKTWRYLFGTRGVSPGKPIRVRLQSVRVWSIFSMTRLHFDIGEPLFPALIALAPRLRADFGHPASPRSRPVTPGNRRRAVTGSRTRWLRILSRDLSQA